MLVQDFLQNSAARTPNKVVLAFQERRLIYQEIDAQANRLAQALLDHGVQRGDRVAIYLPNSVEAVAAIFAILKAGTDPNSTNHLLNAFAKVHRRQMGYHPYVLELVNLVREGHLTPEEALARVETPENLRMVELVRVRLGVPSLDQV